MSTVTSARVIASSYAPAIPGFSINDAWNEAHFQDDGFVPRDVDDSEHRHVITMELVYPRIVHSEFLTHRRFARNSASSRAIPYSKLKVGASFRPMAYWGKDGPGMQAGTGVAISKADGDQAIDRLLHGWYEPDCEDGERGIVQKLDVLEKLGLHKSLLNRYLEPFSWITVCCTGTRDAWWSFLKLRNHSAAERHLQELARLVQAELLLTMGDESESPVHHLPYVDGQCRAAVLDAMPSAGFRDSRYLRDLMSISSAYAARVSYRVNGEGREFSWQDNLELGNRLLSPKEKVECISGSDEPVLHGSPLEHAMVTFDNAKVIWDVDLFRSKYSGFGNGERSIVSPYWVTLRQLQELGYLVS